jgi:hypothetical protein
MESLVGMATSTLLREAREDDREALGWNRGVLPPEEIGSIGLAVSVAMF